MNSRILFFLIAMSISIFSYAQQIEIDNSYEKGHLEDGSKVGVWEYFGFDKSLELKIDYDKGTLIYLKPDTSKYLVRTDSVWEYKSLDTYSRYLGSYTEFYQIFSLNMRYPLEARKKKIERTVFLEFEVNEQGQSGNLKIINDYDDYFSDEILKAFNLVPNNWLIAFDNGQKVSSKFILPFYFKLTGGKKSTPYDEIKLNEIDGKKMNEIIITAPSPN